MLLMDLNLTNHGLDIRIRGIKLGSGGIFRSNLGKIDAAAVVSQTCISSRVYSAGPLEQLAHFRRVVVPIGNPLDNFRRGVVSFDWVLGYLRGVMNLEKWARAFVFLGL